MSYQSDHEYDVMTYVDNILDGTYAAEKKLKWACQRFLDDLETGLDRGFTFDWEIADYAINCFSDFKHTKGEHVGQPFELYKFQKFIVANLWGFRQTEDYMRRFSKAFITIARGNGKSPFAAGFANILAFGDIPEEARAEVYSFATKEEQARIVWEEALLQAQTNPDWMRMLQPYRKFIKHIENGSILAPKGNDSKGADGWSISGAVMDELHAWGPRHSGLYSKIRTALGKRRQPLLIMISTEGDELSTYYIEQYAYAEHVVCPDSSVVDDSYFAFIATAERFADCVECEKEGDNPKCVCRGTAKVEIDIADEKYWPQANPMLNETETVVKRKNLREFIRQAAVTPSAELEFRQYHLNQRVTNSSKLITPEMWSLGISELPDLSNMTCYYGFDWGWKNDLTSLALCFPLENDEYAFKVWSWIPEEAPYNLDEEPWRTWIKDGYLRVTAGNTTDTEAIYKCLEEEIIPEYSLAGGTYDGTNAREFGSRVEHHYGIPSYGMPQSYIKYNEPLRNFTTKLLQKKIRHGGNPLLQWCACNVITKQDPNGCIMPSRSSSLSKIDPFCSAIMGFSEANYQQGDPDYEIDIVVFD